MSAFKDSFYAKNARVTDLFDYVRDKARRAFDFNSVHAPTFVAECPAFDVPIGEMPPGMGMGGETPPGLAFIFFDWKGPRDKRASVEMMREFVKKTGATRVALAAEAWMIVREAGETGKEMPSEAADRQEVLAVFSQDSRGQTRAGYFDIVRDSSTRARCGVWHDMSLAEGAGLLTGIIGSDRIIN